MLPGYNSRWGLEILNKIVPNGSDMWSDLLLTVIFFGANDAVSVGDKQYVPLDEYRSNLVGMVDHLRMVSKSRIILVTPPPVCSAQWPTRSIENAATYAEEVRSVALDMNTLLLDLWNHEGAVIDLSDLRDGLHFGESGNRKMAEGIKAVIRSNIPELCPEIADTFIGSYLQIHFPYHGDLGDATLAAVGTGTDPAVACKEVIDAWHWKTSEN